MSSKLRTNGRICCVAIVLLGIAATAHAQQGLPPAEVEPEEPVSSAHAVLRVVCPADSGLTAPALIEDLVQTGDGVTMARRSFEEEFGKETLKAAEAKGLFEITLDTDRFSDLPAGVFMADITVDSYDKRLPADKLLQKVQEGLRLDLTALDRDPRADDMRRLLLERESSELQERAIREAKEIDTLERQLGLNISADVAGQRLLRVDGELMAARLRVTGLKAAKESLQKRIADLAPKVANASQKDPVVIELEKVVRLREEAKAISTRLVTSGQVTQGNLRDAEENLAQARAEYAKQVRVATQDAGGLRLAELQQRLDDTESELEESEVKLTQLQKQFETVYFHGSTPELEHKKAMLEILRKAANKVTSESIDARLQRQFHVAPTVKLIAAKTTVNDNEK